MWRRSRTDCRGHRADLEACLSSARADARRSETAEIAAAGTRSRAPPGVLGTLHQELAAATGRDPDSLLVLSKDYDPYGLDTPANRRRAEWLGDAMQAVGIATRTIHVRGIFYALVAAGNILRHDGKPFTNTNANWGYLQRIERHARWLHMIDPTLIIDERNTPPIIRLAPRPSRRSIPRLASRHPN